MQQYNERVNKSQPTEDVRNALIRNRIVCDGGLDTNLTAFQRAALAAIAGLDDSDELAYGVAIRKELERYYGDEVHDGRVYPNLSELVDFGLVTKHKVDERTKRYEITEEGLRTLKADLSWHARRIGMQLVDDDRRLQEQPQEADD